MFEKPSETDTYSIVPKTKESWVPTRLLRASPIPSAKWPDPHLSTGLYRHSLGELNFWDVTGPALEKLTPLKTHVQKILSEHAEDLKPDLRKSKVLPVIQYDLFMIGITENTSSPTLVIICVEKITRGKVIRVIRRCKVLDSPKYAGVLLGQSSRHPRYPTSKPPLYVAADPPLNEKNVRPVYISRSDPWRANGLGVYVAAESSDSFRKATIGGFLDLKLENNASPKTVTVGMTSAHVFEHSHLGDAASTGTEDEDGEGSLFEFELDGDDPESDSGPENVYSDDQEISQDLNSQEGTSQHSSTAVIQNIPLMNGSGQEIMNDMETPTDLIKIGTLYAASVTTGHRNFDWALVEINPSDFIQKDLSSGSVGRRLIAASPRESQTTAMDMEVTALLGSKGAVMGTLCSTPLVVRMEKDEHFQEYWTVQLDKTLSYGDSGSWIFSANYAEVLGHLVAGDPSSGLAYIFSARDTIRNIEQQLRCTVTIYLNERSLEEQTKTPITASVEVPQPFSHKLYYMLEDQSLELISWSPSDKSFIMSLTNDFSKLLSKYFEEPYFLDFSQFVKALNTHGFHKVNEFHVGSPGSPLWTPVWVFAHQNPNFIREDLLSVEKITRLLSDIASLEREALMPQAAPPGEDLKSGKSKRKSHRDSLKPELHALTDKLTTLEKKLHEVQAKLQRSKYKSNNPQANQSLAVALTRSLEVNYEISTAMQLLALNPSRSFRKKVTEIQDKIQEQIEILRAFTDNPSYQRNKATGGLGTLRSQPATLPTPPADMSNWE